MSRLRRNLITHGTLLNDCNFGNGVVAVLASIVVISASSTILLRPLVLWKENKPVLAVLTILLLTHWGIGLNAAIGTVRVSWSPNIPQCASTIPIGSHGMPSIIAFYFFTVLWDLIILIFTAVGLHRQYLARSSTLWKMLYKQGILYVVVAFAVNIPMLVFSWLNLNGTMNIFFAAPGGTISVMASSSALVSLLKLKREESESAHQRPLHVAVGREVSTVDKNDVEANQLTSHIDLPTAFSTVPHVADTSMASVDRSSFVIHTSA
ncbi:unnamed protein product [Somion occarium]|uniref:G-protein coupled receptors family 3 profile domain-containing protein n=1 Tax=Somion occarium TaxID=3059160 RepID=A0ABP1DUH9_9APHY